MPTGSPQAIVPGVWSLGMTFGESSSLTNCYIIRGQTGLSIVDPGFFSADNCDRLEAGLSELGFSWAHVDGIYATHLHIDHIGMTPWLSERTGIRVALHSADAKDVVTSEYRARFSEPAGQLSVMFGVPDAEFERVGNLRNLAVEQGPEGVRTFDEAGPFDLDGVPVDLIPTPGHTRGHACMVIHQEGLVLTGDHILEGMRPGVGLGLVRESNPVADYLVSLETMSQFDDYTALPGHGEVFGPLGPRRARLAELLQERIAQVRDVAGEGMSVWEVAKRLSWSRDFESMTGVRLRSALTQTDLLVRYIRA